MDKIKCEGCGEWNAADSTFCRRCSYPIRGATVHDFIDSERNRIWKDLTGIFQKAQKELSDPIYHNPSIFNHYPLTEPYFYRNWLRPFDCLWDTIVGQRLSEIEFPQPSMDLGCGDGTFSSIFLGTKFSDNFDLGCGINPQKKDIYDHFEEGIYKRFIVEPTPRPFDLGIDIKISMVKKAFETSSYRETRVDDGIKLENVNSNSIQSIWSNVIKNFIEIESCLKNVFRVLKKGGMIVTLLPVPSFLDNLYYYPLYLKEEDPLKKELLFKLTRGEPHYHPRYLTAPQWCELFEKMGFKRVEVMDYVINKYVVALWDTCFRTFSFELRAFSNFLRRIGAYELVKKQALNLYKNHVMPVFGYEKLENNNINFSFILLQAFK